MFKGYVLWFNDAKGFGFLRALSGEEVFCHHTAIQSIGHRTLNQHEDVEFDMARDDKGRWQAVNVWRSPGGAQ